MLIGVRVNKTLLKFLVEASAGELGQVKIWACDREEYIFGHVCRLTVYLGDFRLALELLDNSLIDSVDSEPLDIVVLVHEFDAIRDVGNELFLLIIIGCE